MQSRYRKSIFKKERPLAQIGLADLMSAAAQLRSFWVTLRDVGAPEANQDEMKEKYYRKQQTLKQVVGAAVEAELRNNSLEFPRNRRYILGSAPEFNLEHEPVLALISTLTEKLGFISVAGDARDHFHTKFMSLEEMDRQTKGWRTAWKGKCKTAVDIEIQRYPDATIVLITFEGGDECQWEVNEMDSVIVPFYPDGKVQRHHYASWHEALKDMCDLQIASPEAPASSATTEAHETDVEARQLPTTCFTSPGCSKSRLCRMPWILLAIIVLILCIAGVGCMALTPQQSYQPTSTTTTTTSSASPEKTIAPTPLPSHLPTPMPSPTPRPSPTPSPTPSPSPAARPTPSPTPTPTKIPTAQPTEPPTPPPTPTPTKLCQWQPKEVDTKHARNWKILNVSSLQECLSAALIQKGCGSWIQSDTRCTGGYGPAKCFYICECFDTDLSKEEIRKLTPSADDDMYYYDCFDSLSTDDSSGFADSIAGRNAQAFI